MTEPQSKLPDIEVLKADYLELGSIVKVGEKYGATRAAVSQRFQRAGVDLDKLRRKRNRKLGVKPVLKITEEEFARDLKASGGSMKDAVASRGVSRYVYVKALSRGGVEAEQREEMIFAARREAIKSDYLHIADRLGSWPNSTYLQRHHKALATTIDRYFGGFARFERILIAEQAEKSDDT